MAPEGTKQVRNFVTKMKTSTGNEKRDLKKHYRPEPDKCKVQEYDCLLLFSFFFCFAQNKFRVALEGIWFLTEMYFKCVCTQKRTKLTQWWSLVSWEQTFRCSNKNHHGANRDVHPIHRSYDGSRCPVCYFRSLPNVAPSSRKVLAYLSRTGISPKYFPFFFYKFSLYFMKSIAIFCPKIWALNSPGTIRTEHSVHFVSFTRQTSTHTFPICCWHRACSSSM